jgi:3-hydroxyacyl-[acyl-carrier-protein] dehydratase
MRFLMIDRICELVPGVSIRAEKTLHADEELFRDHFPGFPVVPGVLLTEMMAQAMGKCLDAQHLPRGKAMLLEIRNARFRGWVRPEETAVIFATISSSLEQIATAQCHIEVGGERKCSAEIRASFVPRGQLAADFRDDVLEDYLKRQGAAAP